MVNSFLLRRLLLAGALVYPGAVTACSCATQDMDTHISRTPYIFSGTVLTGEAVTRTECEGHPPRRVRQYTLELKRAYKGTVSDPVKLWSPLHGATCGISLAVGSDYLVFAYADERENLTTGQCTLTSRLDEARQVIERLEHTLRDRPPRPTP